MAAERPVLLALNTGSSSLKFAVFARGAKELLRGSLERIGGPGAVLNAASSGSAGISRPIQAADAEAAFAEVLDFLDSGGWTAALQGIGHRVVHGGPRCAGPSRIDPGLLEYLRGLVPLDPVHLPAQLRIIGSALGRFPEAVQVACFDTAFHHSLPKVSSLLPIPRRYLEAGARRFGFHGLSYAFLMEELARMEGPRAAAGRIILAHLGNGASLAAVRDGTPVDTSMGLTPASGIPMGTRTGDVDPGLPRYLEQAYGVDAQAFEAMANRESGLLGLSETSSDMRDLLAREGEDRRAAEAVDCFCYQVKKTIGAYAAALGGLDCLVFSGGIGERAPVVRARICAGLEFLGVRLRPEANEANAKVISQAGGAVVRVMATDEERMIALETGRVLGMA